MPDLHQARWDVHCVGGNSWLPEATQEKMSTPCLFISLLASCSWIALTFHSDSCPGVQVTTENWKLLDHSPFLVWKHLGLGFCQLECGPEQKPPPEWTIIAGSVGTHLYLLGALQSAQSCAVVQNRTSRRILLYHSWLKTSTVVKEFLFRWFVVLASFTGGYSQVLLNE